MEKVPKYYMRLMKKYESTLLYYTDGGKRGQGLKEV